MNRQSGRASMRRGKKSPMIGPVMNIRPKTLRRLLFLCVAVSLAVGLLLWVYVRSVRRNEMALSRLHDQALEAYHANDFDRALELLSSYREKSASRPPQADIEFAYGRSRARVELPNRRHVAEAIHTFEQYLQNVQPGDPAAQLELLKLYVQEGYRPEALRLADDMLAHNDADPDVLEQKALALIGQRRNAEAMEICTKLTTVAPLNLRAQLLTVYLMGELNDSPETIIAHAKALRDAHDGDPRFDLLMAVAYQGAKQYDEAARWLRSAAGRQPPNAAFVQMLVGQLDQSEMFPEGSAFLTRAADALPDISVQRLHAQRLWQDLKPQALADRLKTQDPGVAASDSILLGYRALALYALDHAAEARKIVDALSHRKDGSATAWVLAFRARDATPPLSGPEVAERLRQALAHDSENPVIHVMLAEVYLRMNETELAISQAAQAVQESPSWSTPYVLIAEAQTSTGRNGEAVEHAKRAVRRLPTRQAQVVLIKAFYAWINEAGLASDYSTLLKLAGDVQKTWHDAPTLPIYVTVLCKTGDRAGAIAAAREALAANPPLPAETIAALADVADAQKLGIGQEIRDSLQKTRGLIPEAAMAQARALLHGGNAAAGEALLVNASKGHEADLAWRVTLASYREIAQNPAALRDWIALGDGNPDDLSLQQAILRAPSRMANRAFWDRTIDRVKRLTGEAGQLWRIERGRYLLTGELTERDKAEAVNLLTQVTRSAPTLAEPRTLLAQAMEKVNNVQGAIGELSAAAESHNSDPSVTRELVRLLLASNRPSEALAYLEKLSTNRNLTPVSRHWLAGALADLGYDDKALTVLLQDSSDESIERRRMLAVLYRRLGRGAEAAAVYKELFKQPVSDPSFWSEGADFFASEHDGATAREFLTQLSQMPLAPGELDLALAQFADRWADESDALKHFQAASAAAPASASIWSAVAEFHLRRRHFSQAVATAAEGLKSCPGNATLIALKSEAENLSGAMDASDQSGYATLIEALSRNPLDAGAAEMARTAAAAHAQKLSMPETASRLRSVADRFPQNLALQMQTCRSLTAAGANDAADDVARRAAETHPNSAEPQRFLAALHAGINDWPKAEQAALLWLQRAPDAPLSPSLALAEIQLRRPDRDPAGALRVLAPFVTADAPAKNPQALSLYLKALILTNHAKDASDLLIPLVSRPSPDAAGWRNVWLDLASSLSTADSAMDWVRQGAGFMPKEAMDDRLSIARAWYAVGSQWESAAALHEVDLIVNPLLESAAPPPQALLLAALTAQAKSDLAGAEALYRRLLKLTPSSPDAMNNLAYVLWLESDPSKLAEAKTLSQSAIAARPIDASFYDTLARIEAKLGDRDGAISAFRTAIRRDSASVEAMIGLADLLSHDPAGRDEARDLLSQIQRLIQSNPRLPSVLQKQYRAAQDAIASSL